MRVISRLIFLRKKRKKEKKNFIRSFDKLPLPYNARIGVLFLSFLSVSMYHRFKIDIRDGNSGKIRELKIS